MFCFAGQGHDHVVDIAQDPGRFLFSPAFELLDFQNKMVNVKLFEDVEMGLHMDHRN